MNRTFKLALDFLFGLIIPIIILSRFSEELGNVTAYVVSALVPVAWVAIDLFFITKRFNFITSFLGLNAVLRGILAFWFVDGVAYAFKDSAPSLLWVVIFGASLVFGRPLFEVFVTQGLGPKDRKQENALKGLYAEPQARRSLWGGTAAIVVIFIVTTIANFFLNLWIVVAQFGTQAFNSQVAESNAIARFAIAIPEAIAMVVIMGFVLKAIYAQLPQEDGETDIWKLIEKRNPPDTARP